MTPLRSILPILLTAALAIPAPASAKPRLSGTFPFPHGLDPGGFVEHGTVAGPGNTVWMTTETGSGSKAKPVLLRVEPSGRETSVKIPVPGGIEFSGVGLGPHNQVWFSGFEGAAARNGVNGTVTGTVAHYTIASDSSDWDQLAVIGGTAYLTTGFNLLRTSTNGTSFGSLILDDVSPFDITVFNGGLALAGDSAIGLLGAASLGPATLSSTLITSPSGVTPSSRFETVAGGKLWFLQDEGEGASGSLGSAGADGVATITPLSGARNITTGPDGAPWVLTSTAALRIGPTGTVTATVKFPHGLSGILIAGASKKYIWVATLNRSSGASKLVRISV